MSTTPFTPVLTPGDTPDVTVREDPRAAARARIEAWDALRASIPQRAQERLDYWEDRDNAIKGIFSYDRDPVARAFAARYARSEEDDDPSYLRADRGVLRDVVDSATLLLEEPPLLIRKRMEALVAHVAQLAVAQSAGSDISVAAVINVARVAFPQVYESSNEIERLIDIGVAGMMVMRNVDTTCWYSARRDQFGDGVRKSWEYSFVFRPDNLMWARSRTAVNALTLK